MKILITTGIFRPEVGGPATYAAELAERLVSAGHSVEVITYSSIAEDPHDRNYHFPIRRIVRGNKLWNYIRYYLAVRHAAPKADLIYSLDWFSAGLPVMIAAKRARKPYVLRIGGGYIWEKYLRDGKPPMTLAEFYAKKKYRQYPVMFWLIGRVLREASFVVFNSDIQRDMYLAPYRLSREKTMVIQNALPSLRLAAIMRDYKKFRSEPDKEIVFAGRFIKMKNIELLIHAFARLQDSSFRLLLVGDGPTELELRVLVKELGLHARVEFLKPMPQAVLYRRIANCYLVVIPSWTDVSPNQAYECLDLGIPVLVTRENYLPIRDRLPHSFDPASPVELADKLNILLDRETYLQFVETEAKISIKRTWNEVVIEHIRLFNSLA